MQKNQIPYYSYLGIITFVHCILGFYMFTTAIDESFSVELKILGSLFRVYFKIDA